VLPESEKDLAGLHVPHLKEGGREGGREGGSYLGRAIPAPTHELPPRRPREGDDAVLVPHKEAEALALR